MLVNHDVGKQKVSNNVGSTTMWVDVGHPKWGPATMWVNHDVGGQCDVDQTQRQREHVQRGT